MCQTFADGRYRVIRELGVGGMARVLLAQDTHLDASVAVKELKEHLRGVADIRARFVNEAQVMFALSQKGVAVVPVHNLLPELPGIVMQYMPGGDLEALVCGQTTGTGIELTRMCTLLDQILVTLGQIHGEGVVHRDIKPSNIFLDSDGRPYIGDLGIAHIPSKKGLTVCHAIMGSGAYMALESRLGLDPNDVKTISDIYSAGALAYFMFTGEDPPFDLYRSGKNLDMLRNVPEHLRDVVARATASERSRFASTEEMREALAMAVTNRPEQESLPPRHPTIVATAEREGGDGDTWHDAGDDISHISVSGSGEAECEPMPESTRKPRRSLLMGLVATLVVLVCAVPCRIGPEQSMQTFGSIAELEPEPEVEFQLPKRPEEAPPSKVVQAHSPVVRPTEPVRVEPSKPKPEPVVPEPQEKVEGRAEAPLGLTVSASREGSGGVKVRARINPHTDSQLTLYFRASGESTYKSVAFLRSGDTWIASTPALSGAVEYHVQASSPSGERLNAGNGLRPLRIAP